MQTEDGLSDASTQTALEEVPTSVCLHHLKPLPFSFAISLLSFVLFCCLAVLLIVFRPSFHRDNAENMYFFSSLALTLNESEEGIAPTDSRMRPDQRLMEAGLWDEANVQKQRLEECQRLERKRREAQATQALEEGEMEETVACFSYTSLNLA